MSQQFRIPVERPVLADRKTRFAELNVWVTERGGWLTSVPGEIEVSMECLPGSTIPADLRARGYDIVETGEGERILASAIKEDFTTGTDGELELLTSRQHAGGGTNRDPRGYRPGEALRHQHAVTILIVRSRA